MVPRGCGALALALCLCSAVGLPLGGSGDVVLPAPEGKEGAPAALLFAQGAGIPPSAYEPLAQALQQAASFPLWFAAPEFPGDSAAVPGALTTGMARAKKGLAAAGMPSNATLFFGGHSLGGAMLPDYVKDKEPTAAGMVLMGAFLTRAFKTGVTSEGRPQVEFPVPTLTIGGELDGLCRLTRVAEALYSQITFSADPSAAARSMPVTVVEGMNHMQFASGEPPKLVKLRDLRPEVSEDDAHALVAADALAFLEPLLLGDSADASAWATLDDRVSESTNMVQPIVDALHMEAYAQFLPPCYCEADDEYGYKEYGTCESQPNCTGGVPWTGSYAMPIMGGGLEGLTINAVDSLHLVTEERPSCHLPHIHGNEVDNANPGSGDTPPICDSPDGCALEITTVTQQNYDNSGEVDLWRLHFSVDTLDTGFLPIAARELKAKLKSREAVYEAAGVSNVNFTETDEQLDRCAEVNKAAIDWAFDQLPKTTATRFQNYGQRLEVGPDLRTCIAGPCWIWDPLRFEKDDEANKVTVQSVFMATENKNNYPCGESKLVPCDAGFHYCKLLSPARALEWFYVDGLRLNYQAYTQGDRELA